MGYKVKRILIYPDGVTEKQVYPAGWQPDASRTLLYLPLESNATDMSGNNRETSPSGITYTTVGGVPSAHIGTTSGSGITIQPQNYISTSLTEQTVSALIYVTSQTSSSRRNIMELQKQGYVGFNLVLKENQSYYSTGGNGTGDTINSPSGSIIANQRNHIVLTNSSAGKKLYINGSLAVSGTGSSTPRGNWGYSYENNTRILASRNNTADQQLNGNAREIILEKILWSDEDVSKYYQRIKAKLGI